MITPTQIELVQDSFAIVVPRAAVIARMFYDRLFEIRPDFRVMFPTDMETQRSKLVVTLATVVQSLHQLDDIIEDVRKLGQRHVAYDVADEDYLPVGEALIWTLEAGLGDAWNEEVKDAWIAAYTLLSNAMTEAAAEIRAA